MFERPKISGECLFETLKDLVTVTRRFLARL